jgi:hypothetical protein
MARWCPTSPCGADHPTGGDDDDSGNLLLPRLRHPCGGNTGERDGGIREREVTGKGRNKKERGEKKRADMWILPFKTAKGM